MDALVDELDELHFPFSDELALILKLFLREQHPSVERLPMSTLRHGHAFVRPHAEAVELL